MNIQITRLELLFVGAHYFTRELLTGVLRVSHTWIARRTPLLTIGENENKADPTPLS